MRLGVVDVGSRTVRLLVAEGDGAVPLPLHTAKHRLRLADHLGPDGSLSEEAVGELARAVGEAHGEARRWGAEPLVFATSIVRDAANKQDVVRTVRERTGVPLCVMSGQAEAEFTFLAARRWMGWRAGPMLLLDIGGGALKVGFGRSGVPDLAVSLPLGAGHLTRQFLGESDPPGPEALRAVRREVRHRLRDFAARMQWERPLTCVATSRTFQQLARLCGAPPGREGPFAQRLLHRRDLRATVRRLADTPADERAELPGISAARGAQSLAGAVIAHTAMKLLGVRTVTICPWGLREGILLKHLEGGDATWWNLTHGLGGDAANGPRGQVDMRLPSSRSLS
ncbi:Ppx/GppA family phosphatase [Streptomyces daliensis]|uniref:Ppx/GppA family phosphatase n=1 Tax=Streptomyces daliensis TaxID=299421 RepID=A0A8T4II83_9ACTN|nr:Ppx/GppA family phosphatase [Streptomyces daliensis]